MEVDSLLGTLPVVILWMNYELRFGVPHAIHIYLFGFSKEEKEKKRRERNKEIAIKVFGMGLW